MNSERRDGEQHAMLELDCRTAYGAIIAYVPEASNE